MIDRMIFLAMALMLVLNGLAFASPTAPHSSDNKGSEAKRDSAQTLQLGGMFVKARGSTGSEDPTMDKREQMVQKQIEARGVSDPKVLAAMRHVPRHLFVATINCYLAYGDHPVPIGYGQTISQPYIVAFMTEEALLKPEDKVLEIGTGSGYQAAVLAEIVDAVYTIEIVQPLSEQAEKILKKLNYDNIFFRVGDGYKGWPEEEPFDVIIVTAAPESIPQELVRQLKVGGRMVIPVGSFYLELVRITKTEEGVKKEALLPVRFVPMIHGDK